MIIVRRPRRVRHWKDIWAQISLFVRTLRAVPIFISCVYTHSPLDFVISASWGVIRFHMFIGAPNLVQTSLDVGSSARDYLRYVVSYRDPGQAACFRAISLICGMILIDKFPLGSYIYI